jgi:hypothetical protein
MRTKIDLCSEALLKIGEQAITSFNGQEAAQQIASKLYDTTIDSLLAMHAWRFAAAKRRLSKTSDGDFLIPADIIRVIGCSAAKYEILGNRIAADADEIEIYATARIGTESFPAYFAAAAATKLAMEFCIPLTGSQNTLAILNALFESEMRAAKFIDSAAGTNQSIGEFSLISARF